MAFSIFSVRPDPTLVISPLTSPILSRSPLPIRSRRPRSSLSRRHHSSALMANLRRKVWQNLFQEASYSSMPLSGHLRKLRPMILKRIEARAKEYPLKHMVPVAKEVLEARKVLIRGVSMLLQVFPVMACKLCSEVFVGKEGHLIQTCRGYTRRGNSRVHEWVPGSIDDILVPVEAYHLHKMSQGIIKHKQRFDYDRVPAVLELCCQAGAIQHEELLDLSKTSENPQMALEDYSDLSGEDLSYVAVGTARAWETVRSGVLKLLLAYPSKVCKHCSEVHIGPSGHKARLCGIFKYENWRGIHFWQKAGVNDLVPEKLVWHRRPQDPLTLLNEGRDYYGHAPAVVSLCSHAGVVVPTKYAVKMKPQGLSFPATSSAGNCMA